MKCGLHANNDEFKVAADKMSEIILAQVTTLKTKKSDW